MQQGRSRQGSWAGSATGPGCCPPHIGGRLAPPACAMQLGPNRMNELRTLPCEDCSNTMKGRWQHSQHYKRIKAYLTSKHQHGGLRGRGIQSSSRRPNTC